MTPLQNYIDRLVSDNAEATMVAHSQLNQQASARLNMNMQYMSLTYRVREAASCDDTSMGP